MTSRGSSQGQDIARAQAWRSMRYQSARKPKLRAAALVVPPPIPEIAAPQEADDQLGPVLAEPEPEEVGLRVLAALESMPSLEPDFSDDLASEASVTIIERADVGVPEAERHYSDTMGSLRARLDDMGVAPDIVPDEYAAYQGPIEEAVVEIIERPVVGQNAAAATGPSDLAAFKPLSKALPGAKS